MDSKNEEQLIYVKDLVFVALRGWKAVLAAALILGILLGGWQAVSGLIGAKTLQEPDAEQLQLYEEEKARLEQRVEMAERNLDSHKQYLANTLLMKLDPYCCYEARLSLFVKTEQTEPELNVTADILGAYEAALSSGAVFQTLAQELQTEPRYLSELLTAQKTETAGTLTLQIKLPTQDAAQQALDAMVDKLSDARKQVEGVVPAHKLTVVEEAVAEKVDTDLLDRQQKAQDRMTVLEKALTDAQTAQSALVAPSSDGANTKSMKKAVIFAVLGAVVGAFLTVCVLWVLHITDSKIYNARNLTNRTGVKVLGRVGTAPKNPVDRWLYLLEGRSAEGVEDSAVAVDIRFRARDSKFILITGTGTKESREALTKAVAAAMPGAKVEDHGNILKDGTALEALAACDGVVLEETCGVSGYSSVERQLEVIKDYGAEILGCVLKQ